MIEVLEFALNRMKALWLEPRVAGSFLTLLAVFLVVLRARFGREARRRLLSGGVRTDALYTVFYVGGLYAFFISGPMYRLLADLVSRHAPFLRMNLLAGLPVAAQFLISSVVMDGVLYWAHRWAHLMRWLWAFHSIHHSTEELTPLANFRFHFVDASVKGLVQFAPALILGAPTGVWVATVWIQVALEGLAHSGLSWDYGTLGGILVNPGFHRVHHSVDPAHQNRNFGLTYSFWDRLFGTAAPRVEAPTVYGTPGLTVPESFLRQLAFPFVLLARGFPVTRRPPAAGLSRGAA